MALRRLSHGVIPTSPTPRQNGTSATESCPRSSPPRSGCCGCLATTSRCSPWSGAIFTLCWFAAMGTRTLGSFALPDGFKRPTSRCTQRRCAIDEEAVIAAPGALVHSGACGDPDRDPRGHIVSIASLAVGPVGPDVPDLVSGSDAADTRLWRAPLDAANFRRSLALDSPLPLRRTARHHRRTRPRRGPGSRSTTRGAVARHPFGDLPDGRPL